MGPDWLGEWPRLRQAAADEGIADRVEFVGRVAEEELKRWLAEAHFFVSASAYEGFGIAAVEAMATGTVPILSDIVAFRNLTQGGNCGTLADFDHPSEAAETIAPRPRHVAGAVRGDYPSAPATAASRYSWQAVGEKFLSLYGELAGIRSPAQAVESSGQLARAAGSPAGCATSPASCPVSSGPGARRPNRCLTNAAVTW